MEREEETLFPNPELFSSAERMRHGMQMNRREVSEQPTRVGENMFVELTPIEQEIAKTVCPDFLQLELGVEFIDPTHPELGWQARE